uniref:Receptor kinase-like protein Xa21 n=1 Tax=Leersia perrieri TaxID=77586 RepID=A0A0D9VIB3_9ORYZ
MAVVNRRDMCYGQEQHVKLAVFMQLILLLVCYGVGNGVHCSTLQENSADLQSLLDFKMGIIEDPYSLGTAAPTSAGGVVSSAPLDGHGLNLTDKSLAGKVSSSLANLTSLSFLDLSSNHFFGQFPLLNHLQQLETLYMNSNSLDGITPDTLTNCSKLRNIDLSGNQLRGTIPPKIGSLTNLEFLDLGNNQFTGIIPATVGNLTQLQFLRFRDNQLEGNIPDGVWKLSNLTSLVLGQNRLSGGIPQALNLPILLLLGLEENMLGPVLPPNIGYARPSLKRISLFSNKFEGHIPTSIGNALGLQILDFSKNNFTGQIPTSIGRLSQLSKLNLEMNQLEASEDQGFTVGWKQTIRDSSPSNAFVGPIPPSIGNLTRLIELFLDNNKLDGSIPPSLGYLTQLLVVDLSCNNLQGSIHHIGDGNLKQLVKLHLSSNKFSGGIPDALGQSQNLVIIQLDQNILTGDIPLSSGNLKALNILDLSHNYLSGTILSALNDLQLLSKLDLSYNQLQGEIPRNGIFENTTAVSLDGNWRLCGGAVDFHMPLCSAASRKIERKCDLVRLLIPIFGFMSLTMLIYVITLGKRKSRKAYLFLFSFGKQFPKVSHSDLVRATGNFSNSNLIGRGSYGSVYKGKLTMAKIDVAIKVFNLEMRRADRSFVSECEVLRTIRHRNLLPILTACSTIDYRGKDFRALIYELMHNSNLDRWLHCGHAGVVHKGLSMDQRVSIAVNIADALVYLHHDCGRPIVHCDVKPMNILLDEDMSAHLGDFGIASLVLDSPLTSDGNSGRNSSIVVKGTIGYIAPEYAQSVHASTYGDVYSFGVVLMEMLIGKRPTDSMFENELSITNFVEKNFPDNISHIIDAYLQEECKGFIHATRRTGNATYKCLVSLTQVALSCTRPIPTERMNMREIAVRLHAIRTSYVEAIKK